MNADIETARREVTRSLGLTIAYKAANDDLARVEVVLAIRKALEVAFAALQRLSHAGSDA